MARKFEPSADPLIKRAVFEHLVKGADPDELVSKLSARLDRDVAQAMVDAARAEIDEAKSKGRFGELEDQVYLRPKKPDFIARFRRSRSIICVVAGVVIIPVFGLGPGGIYVIVLGLFLIAAGSYIRDKAGLI